MQVVVTAVGPDHCGLADPIIHYVTGQGANIAEIQMYDHDEEALFAMLLRIDMPEEGFSALSDAMRQIAEMTGLSIRVWSPPAKGTKPKLVICTTYRTEPALALLQAIRDRTVDADVAALIGNRPAGRVIAEQFDVPWHDIGDDQGAPDIEQMTAIFDETEADYIILARYMRVLPPGLCWKFAGGRIINLHHGLLPSFPGMRPYHEAYASRMLTYGATCHFIVPDLDAGNQIIYQSNFTVPPGAKLEEIVRQGQENNEPHCLIEGVRRVVAGEVMLHFHRVVAR